MKPKPSTSRVLSRAGRALQRAGREIERAARQHEKDIADIYARLLTPGGSRLDRETRLATLQQEVERMIGLADPNSALSPFSIGLRAVRDGIRNLRADERSS